jgi:hypothetical protein
MCEVTEQQLIVEDKECSIGSLRQKFFLAHVGELLCLLAAGGILELDPLTFDC